jgi:hypothetical protein
MFHPNFFKNIILLVSLENLMKFFILVNAIVSLIFDDYYSYPQYDFHVVPKPPSEIVTVFKVGGRPPNCSRFGMRYFESKTLIQNATST